MSDDFSEQGLRDSFRAAGLSPYMENAVVRWVRDGSTTGSFARAMIGNDLFEAVVCADPTNLLVLRQWMLWWHNHTPGPCHGSKAAMKAWAERGGLNGKQQP